MKMQLITFTTFLWMLHLINVHGQWPQIWLHQDKMDVLAEEFQADTFQLKSNCLQYLFLIEQNVVYKNAKKKLEKIPNYAKSTFEAGETSLLESLALASRYEEIENHILNLSYQITILENKIKLILDTLTAIVPESDTLKKYTSFDLLEFINKQENASPGSNMNAFLTNENHLLEYYNAQESLQLFNTIKRPYIELLEKQTEYLLKEEVIDLQIYFEQVLNILELKLEYLFLLNNFNQVAIKIEHHYVQSIH